MGLQYFGLAQYSLSVAVAVNRFTTVTLSLSYDKVSRIFAEISGKQGFKSIFGP